MGYRVVRYPMVFLVYLQSKLLRKRCVPVDTENGSILYGNCLDGDFSA